MLNTTPEVALWMLSVLEAVDWKWTPAQVLDNEARFPGLLDDVFTARWQYELIRRQMEDESE